jgi:hypothetical protein
MTIYQQLKKREENCIIAGINASNPEMVRIWQENALKIDKERREVEKKEIAFHSIFYYSIIDTVKRPFSNFEIYRRNEMMEKLFPKSGKIISEVLKNN